LKQNGAYGVWSRPGDFFPGDAAVLEVAQQVHLAEDVVLVEQQIGAVVIVARRFLVVVVFFVALSQLTATRRQKAPRLSKNKSNKLI